MLKLSKKMYLVILFLLSLFAVAGCTQSDSKIEEVFNGLFINENLTAVESDLSFPKSINGVDISYLSNKPEIISNEGKVTRQNEDEIVEITITLKDSKSEVVKKVTFTVIKKDDIINKVFNKLFVDVDLQNITSNLTFPGIIDGVEITYNSNMPAVLSNEGKVNRNDEDQIVTISVTLRYNGEEVVKEVKFTVIKKEISKIEIVADNLFKDLDLNAVISDLNLPTLIEGVSLNWTSTNTSVVSDDGKIQRSAANQTVTLNVTLTFNGEEVHKNFLVTVLKDNNLFIEQVFDSLFTIDLTKVTTNLNFVNSKDGVDISYLSSNTTIISNAGVITRGNEDKQVKIYITLTYEGLTVNKEVLITVQKEEIISYPIINAINTGLNQTVTVQGIIIGNVGDSAYIHDGNNGIYLYRFGSGYDIGDEIKTTGTKTIYNGLVQLQNNKNITKVNSNVKKPEAINISSINEINKQSTLYNISDLTITNYDVIKSGVDVFINVKDSNNNTIDILISKHTDSNSVFEIVNKLGNIAIGDTLALTNIISGYYNKYQLVLFSASQITIKHLDDEPIVTKPLEPYYPNPKDMSFLQDELNKNITSGITPEGEANVLIIPVNFTDYAFTDEDLARLEIAFFGTNEETGWESVKSYYNKSSYGKFNFNGRILNPYQTNRTSTYYANKYNNGVDADYEVIKNALQYYDATIDYREYDNNHDGFIDGLYFIYAAPTWYGDNTGSINDSDLWWAYVYQYFTESTEYYDGVEANYYLWAGIDFIDEAFTFTDSEDKYININAATYIHETGHMLGLYDYYDYEEDKGPKGGLGGADMMDYTVGDHNAFSKIMLNWVTPLVVSGKSTIVTIESFTSHGDVILVSNNWNNTYFDEYFLIEFYTPTGLNADHAGFNGLYTISGIKIYHVNSQINPNQDNGELFLYNNSDTSLKILKPIEADNDNSIERTGIAENEDLFQVGSQFGKTTNYRLTNGTLVNFNIRVLNIANESAQIEIEFN